MASTIIAFKKNLEASIVEQVKDLRAKKVRLESELMMCESDLLYLNDVAKAANVAIPEPETVRE